MPCDHCDKLTADTNTIGRPLCNGCEDAHYERLATACHREYVEQTYLEEVYGQTVYEM